MKRSLLGGVVAAILSVPAAATTADSAEMAEVRRMIEQMKADYEQKIEALEQRLKAAEQKAETAADTAETAKQASAASTAQRERSGMGALTSGTYSIANERCHQAEPSHRWSDFLSSLIM